VTHEELRSALGAPERAAIFSREIEGLSSHQAEGFDRTDWMEEAGSEAARLLQQCRNEATAKMHVERFSTAFEGASDKLPAAYLQQLGERVRDYVQVLHHLYSCPGYPYHCYAALSFATPPYPCYTPYPCRTPLPAYVQSGITKALQNQQPLDTISQEVMRHAALWRSRAQGFSAREALLKDTVARIRDGGGRVTVVHGRSGSGKTSLLARASKEVGDGWAAEAAAAREQGTYGTEPIIAVRFCGITPDSSNARALLRSLCEQLASVYEKPPPTTDEWKVLIEEFKKRLLEAPPGRRVAIFIDSLDQLSDDYQACPLTLSLATPPCPCFAPYPPPVLLIRHAPT